MNCNNAIFFFIFKNISREKKGSLNKKINFLKF